MKLKHSRKLFIALSLSSALVAGSISSVSYATPLIKPAANGCVGLECYGAGNGGYGNHLSGQSGTGNLAGYSQVRFDGYRPDPALIPCDKGDYGSSNDRALANLGLSNFNGQHYRHGRVAILRSDNVTATNGVPGSLYWDSGLDFNLRTGATRPTTDPTGAPTQGDPWIGPRWQSNVQYCLPLAGGLDIQNVLTNKAPVISILYKGNKVNYIDEFPTIPPGATLEERLRIIKEDIGRVGLRMKNLTLRIEIEESSSNNAGISIQFEHVKEQTNINVGSLKKYFEFIEGGSDPELAREIWVSGKSKKAPIYANFDAATHSEVTNGPITTHTYDVPLIVKRKGTFAISVDANFNAYVGGNNGTTSPFVGLSGGSTSLWVNAVSIKSVNRR